MTDTKRPLATAPRENGDSLVDLVYDRATDVAVATYDSGETVKFPDCSRYQYGLGLIVNENSAGGFDVAFATLDDRVIALYACMIKGQRDGVREEEEIRETYLAISRDIRLSFQLIGIPATFRRLDHWVLPHLQTLAPLELKALLPGTIGMDIIDRFQAGDYAFAQSSLLRGRRPDFA
jgi:hypothetical protein